MQPLWSDGEGNSQPFREQASVCFSTEKITVGDEYRL